VALYSLEEGQDAALILAIRHQREAGYLGQEEDRVVAGMGFSSDFAPTWSI